jgi:hypothetical protein
VAEVTDRSKHWTLTLSDGRTVTIGASIDEGVWLLHSDPLLRWLTAEDAKAIARQLREAAGWLELNPEGGGRRGGGERPQAGQPPRPLEQARA